MEFDIKKGKLKCGGDSDHWIQHDEMYSVNVAASLIYSCWLYAGFYKMNSRFEFAPSALRTQARAVFLVCEHPPDPLVSAPKPSGSLAQLAW